MIVIGGRVRKNTLAMVDPAGNRRRRTARRRHASSSAVTACRPRDGLTTPYREEAALKQAMIKAANRVVALVDHSKIGHDHFVRFAEWSDIDVLITNTEVGPDIRGQHRSTRHHRATGMTTAPTPAQFLELVAIDVAVLAADFVRSASGRRNGGDSQEYARPTSSHTPTSARRQLIRSELMARCPGSTIVGEEFAESVGANNVGWIVDPIDGTVNFLYDLPVVAVSIAATIDGAGRGRRRRRRPPARRLLCDTGSRGSSQRHRSRCQCSDRPVTSPRRHRVLLRRRAEVVGGRNRSTAVLPACRDIRCMGSAALNLCWVGCGRLDGFYERDLKVYDYAAGALIAAEGGATVERPAAKRPT